MGRIGTEVAKRAQAFGMKTIAYDKYVEKSDFAEMKSLDEVLAEADYLSLHTPLTDETRGMVDKDFISKMKDGAILVNTCRGKCVVEEDVVEALESGKMAGYGNDVWYADPPDATLRSLWHPTPCSCPTWGHGSYIQRKYLFLSSKKSL